MAHCSSTQKRQSPCNELSKKWDIHKLAPPYKPTIQLPMHYSPTNSAQGIDGHGHENPFVVILQSTGPVLFYWRPGTQNLADYWIKHHPASHHKAFWPQILTSSKNMAYKSFVKKILLTPALVKQMAAQQTPIAAKGA